MCTAFHDNEEYKTIEGFLTCTDPEDPSYFSRAPTTATANKSSKWKGGVLRNDDVSVQNSLSASIYGTNVAVIPKPAAAKNARAAPNGSTNNNSSFICSPTPLSAIHTSSVVEEELAVVGGFFTCDDPEREGHVMIDPLEALDVMPTCETYPRQLMSQYAELLHNGNAADDDFYSDIKKNIHRNTVLRDQPPQPRSIASTSLAANSYATPSPRSAITTSATPTGSQVQVWSKSQQLLSESREEMSMITDFLTCQDPTENEPTPRSAPNSRFTSNGSNTGHPAHKAQYVYDYDPQKSELTFSTTTASLASSSPRRPHPAPASSTATNLTSLTMTSLLSDHQLCKVFEDDEYVTFRKVKPSQSTSTTSNEPTYQPRAEVELISKFHVADGEEEEDDWPVVAVHREARKKAQQQQQQQQFQKQKQQQQQYELDDNHQRLPWMQQNKKESAQRRCATGASNSSTRGRRGRGLRRDADAGSPVSFSSSSEHSRKSWGRMMF